MIFKTFVLIFSSFSYAQIQTGLLSGRVDAVTNLITTAGYTSETHRVETDDGYLLKIHRILPKIQKERKGPVLLIHGLFGTAADFLIAGPDVALGYLLSTEGYDVWIGNVRGSKYSMSHRSLNPESRDYWQFSFHEIGFYDLPAMINHVLSFTQKPSLFYVGHNQGTTALLVLLATKPEYNVKILHAQLFAPIAFMDYPHPLISLNLAENNNFFSMISRANLLLETYCTDKSPTTMAFCSNLWFLIFGRNLRDIEMNPNVLLEVPNHISPTASRMQWNHFLQLALSGKFRQYDKSDSSFGFSLNPTEYNLFNVKAPIYLNHAAEDLVVSRLDVERLKLALTSNVREYKVIPNWNHMDFVLSRNARTALYNNIVVAMNNEGLDFITFIRNLFG